MKLSHLLSSLLLAVLLIACGPAQSQATKTTTGGSSQSQTKNDASDWVLTINHTGGIQGVNVTYKILGDGRVLDDKGQEISTSKDQVSALVSEINKVDLFGFSDDYGRNSRCNDCFSIQLKFEKGGKTKTITMVEDNSTEIPVELQQLLQQIGEVIPGY